jgi:serine/threonine protein kinase
MSCGLDISDPHGGTTIAFSATQDDLKQLVREATQGIFDIERELGRGGMAAVFLATEIELKRKVAIKVLPPEMTFGEGMIERFQREARTAAQLDHPNIIPIYRVGVAGRLLYFVMKYVEGRSLGDVLHERGALPIPTTTGILESVASALAYAHERGVVHRDIKPANILIDKQGVVLVADFGIARAAHEVTLTESGAVVGTPQYMSPEQCSGERVTGASDQYSLGVVGFQMLAGRVPFDADSAVALLQKHIFESPPSLGSLREEAPPELISIVHRALEKKAERRFADLLEFAEAVEEVRITEQHTRESRAQLRALATGGTITGLKPATPISDAPVDRPVRRRVPRLAAALVVGTVGAGALWVATRESTPASAGGDDLPTTVPPAETSAALAVAESVSTSGVDTSSPATETQSRSRITPPARTDPPQTRRATASPEANHATLTFVDLPPDAVITVNDSVVADSVNLPAGTYSVVIQAQGYEPYSQELTVTPGQRRRFIASDLAPVVVVSRAMGKLSIGSLPPGVLFINEVRIENELPIRDYLIQEGTYDIRIAAPDHEPFDTTVTIVGDSTVNLGMIRLRPRSYP